MTKVDVTCEEVSADTWRCEVELTDMGAPVSRHTVRVSIADVRRFAPGTTRPEDLVGRSFRFLLDRESPSMILRTFELSDIGRYFPEYDREIRRPT